MAPRRCACIARVRRVTLRPSAATSLRPYWKAALIAYLRSGSEAVAAPDNRPLAGRRIVVTRSPEQGAELALKLAALGAGVLLLSLVPFTDPPQTVELDRAILALAEFDWLIFTS